MWQYVAGILAGAVILAAGHTYLEKKISGVTKKQEDQKSGRSMLLATMLTTLLVCLPFSILIQHDMLRVIKVH